MSIPAYPHTDEDLHKFLARVEKVANGCWLWMGATFAHDYGVARSMVQRIRQGRAWTHV